MKSTYSNDEAALESLGAILRGLEALSAALQAHLELCDGHSAATDTSAILRAKAASDRAVELIRAQLRGPQ